MSLYVYHMDKQEEDYYDPLEKSMWLQEGEEIGRDGEQGKREATEALSQATPPKTSRSRIYKWMDNQLRPWPRINWTTWSKSQENGFHFVCQSWVVIPGSEFSNKFEFSQFFGETVTFLSQLSNSNFQPPRGAASRVCQLHYCSNHKKHPKITLFAQPFFRARYYGVRSSQFRQQ